MTEALLYYIWQFQRFSPVGLQTTDGQSISIEKIGYRNHDAGPDFFDARLRIGDTLWAGNVEMHLNSSDWNRHKHQEDPAYNNTILHVVYSHDKEVFTQDHRRLACLSMETRIDNTLLHTYKDFMHNKKPIACAHHLKDIDTFTWHRWLEALAIERLQAKTEHISQLLQSTHNDWHTAFLITIAAYFGQKVNALPFQILARSIPSKLLSKHHDKIEDLEALLYGQAGMLEQTLDEPYHQKLKAEYTFLKAKYRLSAMPPQLWKYMRMRPASFPELRIAQMAQVLHGSDLLFQRVLAAQSLQEVELLFKVQATGYWMQHYRFGASTTKKSAKSLGAATRRGIIINAVIPFLFVYGQTQQKETLTKRAIDYLDILAAEDNKITRLFTTLGQKPRSALHSQAILQLKKEYCDAKKCLNCDVGNYIFKKNTKTT